MAPFWGGSGVDFLIFCSILGSPHPPKSLKIHWFLLVFEVSALMDVYKKVWENMCEGGFVDASVRALMLAAILYQKRSEIGPKIEPKMGSEGV